MSFYGNPSKVTYGGVDLSDFIRDYYVTLTTEPKRVADNPHAPGTLKHKDWEYANVHAPRLAPHGTARREATAAADERLARLKAARSGGSAPRTFAYGKDVDALMAFIADDSAGPLVADFTENEQPSTSPIGLEEMRRYVYGLKFDWPSATKVQGLLGGGYV